MRSLEEERQQRRLARLIKRRRARHESGCRALCDNCLTVCQYPQGHRRSHGGHHREYCNGAKFFFVKTCRLCNENEILRADWDICRPCGILIEIRNTTYLAEMIRLTREMLRHYGGRGIMSLPPG